MHTQWPSCTLSQLPTPAPLPEPPNLEDGITHSTLMSLLLSVLLCTPMPGENQGKGSDPANPGCYILGKLGKSASQRYFPQNTGFGPWEPGSELRDLHQCTQNQLTPLCPLPLGDTPMGLGLSCWGSPWADSGAWLPVAMATFQRALHSDRDARLC